MTSYRLGTRKFTDRLLGSARDRAESLRKDRKPVRRRRILLVDDAPVNLAAFSRFLDRMECSVDPVSSGEYAVAMFEDGCGEARYDLILIDLHMPGLDGLETARRIRAIEARLPESHPYRRNPVPILALTRYNPGDRMAACRKAGMNDYLYKPLQEEVLREALARWVPAPVA